MMLWRKQGTKKLQFRAKDQGFGEIPELDTDPRVSTKHPPKL